jgi:C4-dicarboxylate-specific signal transduction histidine kinase
LIGVVDLPARQLVHQRFIAEEVASSLRHTAVNKLAGVGALAFHLKRQLPAGQLSEAAAAVLPLLDTQVGDATAALELRFLPPPPAHPDPVPLPAALAETLRASTTAGVEAGPHDACTALVDAAELDLALHCLLENACEAAAGAPVRVRCRVLPDEEEMVAVEVVDRGPGLPERARDPFFTTKPGHLGLGLNIAARVAMRARGRLELQDGDGCTARLVLPRGPQ